MKTNHEHPSFFSPDHHLNENGTALYVEAVLLHRRERLPDEITSHVEGCDLCKEQILGLHELMKEQPIDVTHPHPYFDKAPAIVRFPMYLRLRAAAVFVIILVGGTLFYLFTGRGNNASPVPIHAGTPVSVTPDTIMRNTQKDERFYTDNFDPSPNLDDLVRSDFRSAAIEVLTPDIDAIVSSPITFQWKQYHRSVLLKILNNKDFTLLTSTVQGNRFITAKSFSPGLYYWKLEDNGELLYVGKFFVK